MCSSSNTTITTTKCIHINMIICSLIILSIMSICLVGVLFNVFVVCVCVCVI